MRRILTSALTVLVAAAVPAAANAQLPQIPQLPVSSSSNIQDEINHRIDDARTQVEDITSKAFPQKAPKQKAPTPAEEDRAAQQWRRRLCQLRSYHLRRRPRRRDQPPAGQTQGQERARELHGARPQR